MYSLVQAELKLLMQHHDRLIELEKGTIKPHSKEEKHFLLVSKGKDSAKNQIEKLYFKFKSNLIEQRKYIKKNEPNGIPENIPGRPKSNWYNDPVWNEMHSDVEN